MKEKREQDQLLNLLPSSWWWKWTISLERFDSIFSFSRKKAAAHPWVDFFEEVLVLDLDTQKTKNNSSRNAVMLYTVCILVSSDPVQGDTCLRTTSFPVGLQCP